jgi:ABC-type multidrug transport system ATPase subunit
MNMLQVTGLTKTFNGRMILNDVALTCNTGEIIGIFGRNGTGKSTILKILFGVIKANNIIISINNSVIAPHTVIPQCKIGYLPQESFLPKNIKVRDAVAMFFKGDLQDKVMYAPGIAKIAATRAGSLSMGQLRYLELLLVGNLSHPFLMLDEPFSMIEPLYKDLILEFLQGLKRTKGLIITDHYYKDVFSTTSSNLILKDSRLISINTIQDLSNHGYLPSELKN